MRRPALPWLLSVAAVLGGSAYAGTPSFDCTKTGTPVEKLVCGDPALSALDTEMAAAFRAALAAPGNPRDRFLADQRQWLKDRAGACEDLTADCLTDAYRRRLMLLRGWAVGRHGNAPDQGLSCEGMAARIRAAGAPNAYFESLAELASANGPLARVIEALPEKSAAKLDLSAEAQEAMEANGGQFQFYALPTRPAVVVADSVDGSANCHTPLWLSAGADGTLEPIDPPVDAGSPEESLCSGLGAHLEFGHVGDVPAFLLEGYAIENRSLKLYELRDGQWAETCRIAATYPITLELKHALCGKGPACDALRPLAAAWAAAREKGVIPHGLEPLESKLVWNLDEGPTGDLPTFGQSLDGYTTFDSAETPYRMVGPDGPLLVRITQSTLGWRQGDDWLIGAWHLHDGKAGKPVAGFVVSKKAGAPAVVVR